MLADVAAMVACVMTTQLQIMLADVVAMVADVMTSWGVCAILQMWKPIVDDAIIF